MLFGSISTAPALAIAPGTAPTGPGGMDCTEGYTLLLPRNAGAGPRWRGGCPGEGTGAGLDWTGVNALWEGAAPPGQDPPRHRQAVPPGPGGPACIRVREAAPPL